MLEFIVRTANFRFLEKKQAADSCEAIDRLMDEYIYPNARFMHGSLFRRKHCYNMKINEIYEKNAV